jgi:ATP-dependent phosphofructokinase / diphosphate-dependent phosphofructokinase
MRTLGILVGGGPAPGFNGVINAVTVAARARGWKVLGIPKGFSMLMKGDVSGVRELTEADVDGIEQTGGSIVFTSRAKPMKDPESMQNVVASLKKLGITDLVTIGGDDTATSAMTIAKEVGSHVRVAHVPKTIDNDLPLPKGAPTFGFETARDLAAQLVANLVEDARTSRRWYLVTAMGRSAGHLALGAGLSGGAHLVVIPEEFPDGRPIRLQQITEILAAAVYKRAAQGDDYGVAVFAEGLLDRIPTEDLAGLQFEKDEHGNPRLSEISFGKFLKDAMPEVHKQAKFVAKEIGYELRTQPPNGFDKAYTRQLGVAAVEFLATGQGNALVAIQENRMVPLQLDDLKDPKTGKVAVRRVDVAGGLWQTSLALQARLRPADLEGKALEKMAKLAKTTPDELRARYQHLAR